MEVLWNLGQGSFVWLILLHGVRGKTHEPIQKPSMWFFLFSLDFTVFSVFCLFMWLPRQKSEKGEFKWAKAKRANVKIDE